VLFHDEFNGFMSNQNSSVQLEDQDELDSYITSTDSGPDVLGYWHGKEDM